MLLRLDTRRALARSDRTRDVASSPIRAIRAQSLLSSDFLRFVSSSLDSGPKLLLDRYKKGEGPVPISKDQKRGFFVPFAGSRIEPLIQELVSPLMKEGWRRKREAEADTQNAKVPVCAQRRRPGCGCVADICPARAPREPRIGGVAVAWEHGGPKLRYREVQVPPSPYPCVAGLAACRAALAAGRKRNRTLNGPRAKVSSCPLSQHVVDSVCALL